jgi:outer membrane protein TolC
MKWSNFIFFWCISLTLSAQNLSLSDAIRTALERQHGIRIAEKDREIAENRNKWGETGIMPQLNLNFNPSLSSNSLDQRLVNGTEIRRDNARSEQYNGNVQLNWNFFQGMKMFIAKDRLELLEERAIQNLELESLNLSYQVALSYYSIVRIQNLIKLARAQMELAADRVKLEQIRFDQGVKGKADLLAAQIDLKEIGILLRTRENELDLAYQNLMQWMLEKADQKPLLTDTLMPELNLETPLLLPDLSSHPQVRLYELDRKVLEYSRKEILAERWPALGLLGSYNFNRTENQAGFSLYSQNYGPLAQLQFSMPLFDGGRIGRNSKEFKLQIERNEILKEQWMTGTNYQLAQTRSNEEFHRARYQMESEKLAFTEENLRLTREKHERNAVTSLELRQAQFDLIAAATNKQDAWYQWMVSRLTLRALTGDLAFLLK